MLGGVHRVVLAAVLMFPILAHSSTDAPTFRIDCSELIYVDKTVSIDVFIDMIADRDNPEVTVHSNTCSDSNLTTLVRRAIDEYAQTTVMTIYTGSLCKRECDCE